MNLVHLVHLVEKVYLYGILNGHDPERSAFYANQCAGQVIQILGCRLDSQKLSDLF